MAAALAVVVSSPRAIVSQRIPRAQRCIRAGQPGGPAGTSGPGAGSGGVSYSGPQSMDQYSYYGALPAKKTGNYIPVTADFSSFRH